MHKETGYSVLVEAEFEVNVDRDMKVEEKKSKIKSIRKVGSV